MPDHVYEVLAQGARYWFLFWMVLIVWRSWRWYRKDRRAAKKRLKLLPDAGFVGEMVIMDGPERGTAYPVPREGTLGSLRTNDLCLPMEGVHKRHLWFRFDDKLGLRVEPFGKNAVNVDGEDFQSRREPLYMAHGSWLTAGGVQMRLRLFAGFESVGRAARRGGVEADDPQPPQQGMSPEQFAQMQQMMARQWQMQQQAWMQGYRQAMAQQQAAPPPQPEQPQPEWTYDDDPSELPYDMAQIAREEGMVDNSIFMRPAGQKKPEIPSGEPVFYPPVMDDEAEPEAEDWMLEPEPPKSAYVGDDEAAQAKRMVWDKYFGGGAKR